MGTKNHIFSKREYEYISNPEPYEEKLDVKKNRIHFIRKKIEALTESVKILLESEAPIREIDEMKGQLNAILKIEYNEHLPKTHYPKKKESGDESE